MSRKQFVKLPANKAGYVVPRRVRQALLSSGESRIDAVKYQSANPSINEVMRDHDAKLQRRYGEVK